MEHKPTIRVLEILEALAAENQGVSLTHLSEKTGILKGTIFPILKTLVEQRYTSVMTLIPSFIIWGSPARFCPVLSSTDRTG